MKPSPIDAPEFVPAGMEILVAGDDGNAMVRVGRDGPDTTPGKPENAEFVRIDVLNSTLRMGPTYAEAVALALLRQARSLRAERAPSPSGLVH